MKRLLILMAKQPEPGRTKTRLIPALSPVQAADLYRCFLLDKLDQMRAVRDVCRAVAFHPAAARAYFADFAPDVDLIPQAGADLSQRLLSVCAAAFEQGYRQVVAIDSDTVTLPSAYLQQAFQGLDNPLVDVTLGPCEDGGYYAIGTKRLIPALFDVTMSTPHVLRDTLAQASQAGLRVDLLPEWYDVDRPSDLKRLAADLAAGGAATARASAAFLEHVALDHHPHLATPQEDNR